MTDVAMADLTSIIQKIPNLDYSETVPDINVTEFIKVVSSRRSVRLYEDISIPAAVMNTCLDLALLAPNSSNLQTWQFYWVRTPEKKAKLVEICLNQPTAKTASDLVVFVARTDTWRKNKEKTLEILSQRGDAVPQSALDYYKKLVPFVYTQGFLGLFGLVKKAIMAARGVVTPTPREPTSHAQMAQWAIKSCALAAENFMLALRAHGYDSCPMEGFDSRRLKNLLNLPKWDSNIVMVVSAGKRAKSGVYGPRIRFDRSHFIKEI